MLAGGSAQAADKVRVLFPAWVGFSPSFVAHDLGYDKELGLDIQTKIEDERPNVMAAMQRGDCEIDIRTIGEYQGRPRDDATTGTIIGTTDQSVGGDGVLVDGSIKSAADLKGKVVASELDIPGRLLLQLELKKAGLTLKDLKMKEINTADSVPVFGDTTIAAVATYQPFLSQALEKAAARKPRVLVSSSDYPTLIVDVIIARTDDLKKNPDKYRRYLIALYRAAQYQKTHHAEFVKLAAPHYNLTPEEFEAAIKGALTFNTLEIAQPFFGTAAAKGEIYKTFDTVMQLNVENGSADHKLSSDKAIDSSIIASIKPSDLGK
jgi:NitT/TauT family transport system substrate-binding protein